MMAAEAPTWNPREAGSEQEGAGFHFVSTESGITDGDGNVLHEPEPAAGGVSLQPAGAGPAIDYSRLAREIVKAQGGAPARPAAEPAVAAAGAAQPAVAPAEPAAGIDYNQLAEAILSRQQAANAADVPEAPAVGPRTYVPPHVPNVEG